MVAGTSQIFAAGPPVVERSLGQKIAKDDLGGAALAVDVAGSIDNRAATEAECLALIRRYLSYMPQNVWELPPAIASTDPVDRCEDFLLRIVPEDRRRPYDMRRLVAAVVDRDSLFEIQPTFGKAVITSWRA
jgi:acetyl-CoA carboxylase carboxyltransferase component